MNIKNGQVYQTFTGRCAIVLIDMIHLKPMWGMLYLDDNVIPGLTAPLFQHDKRGKYSFTRSQLIRKFRAYNWKLLDEKIDFLKIEQP